MRIYRSVLALSTTICCAVAAAQKLTAATFTTEQLNAVPGEKRPADRDAIRAHIDSIFQAYMQKDRAKIQATHAPDWRGFLDPSRTIIRGLDEYMQYADRILKDQSLQSYKIIDFDVMFYGDVALVPYVAQLGPEENHVKLRVLDVYAKLKGDWIQVGSDTAFHPDTRQYYDEHTYQLPPQPKKELLDAREAVWRDFFTNNRAHLEETIPAETVAINAGPGPWQGRDQILEDAKQFAGSGGKLTHLEFPKTEMQVYGSVALLYSEYQYELEVNGKTQQHSGRATEMFVNRDGKWVNVGWHLD
jgi:ketosteroid isomerase-like protein